MQYSYQSNGILSRSLRDYREGILSVYASNSLDQWWEKQYQTIILSAAANYGTIADNGSSGIGNAVKGSGIAPDLQVAVATAQKFIHGEKFPLRFSGRAGNDGPKSRVYTYESCWKSQVISDVPASEVLSNIQDRTLKSLGYVDPCEIHIRLTSPNSISYSYVPSCFNIFEKLDYGNITANATTLNNYGSILDAGQRVDYGRINILDTQRPFGFVKSLGGHVKLLATQAYQGSGNISLWGKEKSPAIYKWVADGKVRISGNAGVAYSSILAGGGFPTLRGTVGENFCIGGYPGSGSLKGFSGSSQCLSFSPQENQLLFLLTGTRSSEKNTEAYAGSGLIKKLSGAAESVSSSDDLGYGLFKVTGIGAEAFVPAPEIGSGLFSTFSGAAESITWNPDERQLLFSFIGEIPTPLRTYGNPVSGTLFTFGPPVGPQLSRISDYANVRIHVYANEVVSTFKPDSPTYERVRWTDTLEGGLFRFSSQEKSQESITPAPEIGSGSLKKFSGSAETVTWNPEEKQLLFSFIGGATSEKYVGSYNGSGKIRNLSGSAERSAFDYVGSGIITALPKKQDLLFLEDLADHTLVVVPNKYNQYYPYYQHSGQIGSVQLKYLVEESSQEKFSSSYVDTCIDRWVTSDYGQLAGPCTNIQTISGTVQGNSNQNCIVKVAPGTTATVASNQSYQIALSNNAATNFIDNGYIREPGEEGTDYGWILTNSDILPFGLFNFVGSVTTSTSNTFVNTEGGLKFIGDTKLPLNVSEEGDGTLFSMGGGAWTITTSDDLVYGLYKISGTAGILTTNHYHGSGFFKTLSGAAESVSYIPDEIQLLISFVGGITSEKHTESYVGSGLFSTFSGAAESVSVSDDLVDGLFRITGNATEKNTEAYTGSGSFKKFSGAAESVSWNPEERQLLFSFIGSRSSEKHTEAYVGSGLLKKFSGAAESVSVNYDLGYGLFRVTGVGTEKHTEVYRGSGSFKKFSGAAESITWNPEEKQLLFSFIGSIISEKHTEAYLGSGLFSTFSGAAESVSISDDLGYGLFRVDGTVAESFTPAPHIGSGSLKKFSGAAESITWNPDERQLLFSFTGAAIVPITYNESGSGRLFTISGSYVTASYGYAGSGTIKNVSRPPDESFTLEELADYTLELGVHDIYGITDPYLSGALDEGLGAVPLWHLAAEVSHEKYRRVYDLGLCYDEPELDYGFIINKSTFVCVDASGSITTSTTAASGCVKVPPGSTLTISPTVTYTVPLQQSVVTSWSDYGLVREPGEEGTDYGYIRDTTGYVCPFGSIEISGTAAESYVPVYVGSGTLRISGAAKTFWTPPYYTEGYVGVIGGVVGESFTPATHIGSGTLYSFSGAAIVLGYSPTIDVGLFRLGGDATTLFSLLHIGSGTVKVLGSSPQSFSPTPYIGSGLFKKFSGAAESLTFNPEERQLLFSIVGERIAEKKTISEEGSGTLHLRGTSDPEILTFAEQPFGRVSISGKASTPRTTIHIGSGSFKKFSGAAESFTFNPEEKQLLFSFAGTSGEVFAADPPEEGTEIRLSGTTEPEILTFAEQPFGRISVSGIATTRYTPSILGSGTLYTISGAAESFTFNPEEKQLLFSIIGTGSESKITKEIGEGNLFTMGGLSETISIGSDVSGGLFSIRGDAEYKFQPVYFGSGSLKKFSGAAESLTVNPDERQLLFSIVGTATEKNTEAYNGSYDIPAKIRGSALTDYTPNYYGSGSIRVSGDVFERWVPNNIGSGTLYTFSGAAESFTFNPEEKQLLFSFIGSRISEKITSSEVGDCHLKLTGTSGDPLLTFAEEGSGRISLSGAGTIYYVPSYRGSGTLYTFSGAAESITVNPEDKQILFSIIGESPTSLSVVYTGSGSFKKFSGAAESVSYNPDERQLLFSFTGASSSSKTRAKAGSGDIFVRGNAGVVSTRRYLGEGTIPLSGVATITRTRDFVGSGSLKKFSGSAEAVTYNPEEKDMLFSFMGEGLHSRTSRELSQGGVLKIGSTSGDPKITFAEQRRIEVAIRGEGDILRTFGYAGSGRISNVHSADEAFVRKPYEGDGYLSRIRGQAFVQVVVWQPPNTQVWII